MMDEMAVRNVVVHVQEDSVCKLTDGVTGKITYESESEVVNSSLFWKIYFVYDYILSKQIIEIASVPIEKINVGSNQSDFTISKIDISTITNPSANISVLLFVLKKGEDEAEIQKTQLVIEIHKKTDGELVRKVYSSLT
eukprot:TRINITY_DN8252_c0_g1_i1.p1 TRINITY_DN8252_c0_g1~~TRINITY_DN8252_c0_g1_i1.p1  ORF type:complete len:139 (-),score=25.41 TRINITY_DN8252_c0_g1_i1:104-520(-)